MKILFALLSVLFLAQAVPADATMLFGGIQFRDVEGRVGVRINHYGRVFKVHQNSPAEAAGIQKGDVITSVDGMRKGFVGKIHGIPGTVAHLTVRRAGEELAFSVLRVETFQVQTTPDQSLTSELPYSLEQASSSNQALSSQQPPLLVQR